MILSFTLSMPSNNAWNGRWSGESKLFARTKNFGRTKRGEQKAKQVMDKNRYYYNFGDGWTACVSVAQVTAAEAASIRRKTMGFCGYDWMISSIIERGEISYKSPA